MRRATTATLLLLATVVVATAALPTLGSADDSTIGPSTGINPRMATLKLKVELLQSQEKLLEKICIDHEGKVRQVGPLFPCDEALRDFRRNLADARKEADTLGAENEEREMLLLSSEGNQCRADETLQSLADGLRKCVQIAEEPVCDEAKSQRTFLACSAAVAKNFARGAITSAESLVPVVGMTHVLLSKAPPNCVEELIRGIWVNLKTTVTALWDISKTAYRWTAKKLKGLWHKTAPTENATSDAALLAGQTRDALIARFRADPWKFFEEMGHALYQQIVDGIRDNFMCEEWEWRLKASAIPEQVCTKPLKAWSCANCNQITNAVCGVIGVLGAEIIEAYLTGGTVSLAKAGGGAVARIGAKLAEIFPKVGKAVDRVGEGLSAAGRGVHAVVVGAGKLFMKPIDATLRFLGESPVAKALLNTAREASDKAGALAVRAIDASGVKHLAGAARLTGEAARVLTAPIRGYFELMQQAYELGLNGTAAYAILKAARTARVMKIQTVGDELGRHLTQTERAALDEVFLTDTGATDVAEAEHVTRQLSKAGLSDKEISSLRASGTLADPVAAAITEIPTQVVFKPLALRPLDGHVMTDLLKNKKTLQYVVDENNNVFVLEEAATFSPNELTIGVANFKGKDVRFAVKESGSLEADAATNRLKMKPQIGYDLSSDEAERITRNAAAKQGQEGALVPVREESGSLTRARVLGCAEILAAQSKGEGFLLDRFIGQNLVDTVTIMVQEERGAGRLATKTGQATVLSEYATTNLGILAFGALGKALVLHNVSDVPNFGISTGVGLGVIQAQRSVNTRIATPDKGELPHSIVNYDTGYFLARMPLNPMLDTLFLDKVPRAIFDACRSGNPLRVVISPRMIRIYERGISAVIYLTAKNALSHPKDK